MDKVTKVGTIKGIDILMNRSGKAHKGDLMVRRGTGVHTPPQLKEKAKQKIKQDMRRFY